MLAIGTAAALAASPQLPLDVRVSPAAPGSDAVLMFSVTNASAGSITINESALPWGSRYSLTIVVVPKRKEPLAGVFPVEDVFAEKRITLRPGETRTGEVELEWHARDARIELQDRDLLIFWHYAPETSDGKALGEYGGWTTLNATHLEKRS